MRVPCGCRREALTDKLYSQSHGSHAGVNWRYKVKLILSAERVLLGMCSFSKGPHSTAGVQRGGGTILFLSKLSLSFWIQLSLSLSLLHCQSNSCFSFGQPPNGWVRRVNGFLISLVNTAFTLVSLPQPAVQTPPNGKTTWCGRRGNEEHQGLNIKIHIKRTLIRHELSYLKVHSLFSLVLLVN